MITSTAVNRGPDTPPAQRWLRIGSAIPTSAIAFVAIAAAILVTQRGLGRQGLCFHDPSWYFHAGHRTALGDMPYRDYAFHAGPLPIYLDALSQGVFGGGYAASLYAAMLIKILRVFVIWLIARRLAPLPAAIALVMFCALDPIFSTAHHSNTAYAELFLSLSGLCLLHAMEPDHRSERATRVYLALAGLCAMLTLTAQQGSAVMIPIVLGVACAILARRNEYFTRQRLIALGVGFAGGIAAALGAVAVSGAPGSAIAQIFVDQPGAHGPVAILDAISGGSLVSGDSLSWGTMLIFLALPVAFVAAIVVLGARDEPLSLGQIAVVAVPGAVALGLVTRYAQLNFFTDVPRTFLTAVVGLAIASPGRLQRWLGLDPLVAIGLGALPLASDWALEMSLPGRGPSDAPALVTGVILVVLASRHIAARGKTALCAAIAFVAITGACSMLYNRVNPFAGDLARDGTLTETTFRSRNHRLRGMKITEPRLLVLNWLMGNVPGRSSCFVVGNLPVLYTLLSCQNPTRIDTTAPELITTQDAIDAVARLRDHPPDYLIAHDGTPTSPPLAKDLGDDVAGYAGPNPAASHALHAGLRSLLDRYERIGPPADLLRPDLQAIADRASDRVAAIHLYRRKTH